MKEYYEVLDKVEFNSLNSKIQYKIILLSIISMMSSMFIGKTIDILVDNSNSKLSKLYDIILEENYKLKYNTSIDSIHTVKEHNEILQEIVDIQQEESDIFFYNWKKGKDIFDISLLLFLITIIFFMFTNIIVSLIVIFVTNLCCSFIGCLYRNHRIYIFELFE